MATMFIAYASSGFEFSAQEEAEALDLWAVVPRKVEMIRMGKNRRPDAVVTPYLPNYLFLRATAQEWHWLRTSKHCRSMMAVVPQAEKLVVQFIDKVEADYAQRMAQIEAGQRVDEYEPGDLLEIIAGPFAGTMARFKRVAEGNSIFPQLITEAKMFGQSITVRVDPLDARRGS